MNININIVILSFIQLFMSLSFHSTYLIIYKY